MQISPSTPQPALPVASAADAETATTNRAVSSAVKLLNQNGAAGNSNEFSIAIDPTTRQAVVRIVNPETNEVIEQVPSEYLLQLARNFIETLRK